MVVGFHRRAGRQHAQHARHAQVQQRAARSGVEQQVLGAPAHAQHALARQQRRHLGRDRPAQVGSPQHHAGHHAPLDVGCEAASGGFHFGQFGHGGIVPEPRCAGELPAAPGRASLAPCACPPVPPCLPPGLWRCAPSPCASRRRWRPPRCPWVWAHPEATPAHRKKRWPTCARPRPPPRPTPKRLHSGAKHCSPKPPTRPPAPRRWRPSWPSMPASRSRIGARELPRTTNVETLETALEQERMAINQLRERVAALTTDLSRSLAQPAGPESSPSRRSPTCSAASTSWRCAGSGRHRRAG